MKKIATVLGTRPELTKLSPIIELLDSISLHLIIHTGQHYSHSMDAIFFEELHIRRPDYSLEVGSLTHGRQTGRLLDGLEQIYMNERPSAVVVLGDTNSTLAGALSAAKLHIPVIHIEAGCRSFNRAMPEELNRVIVDHISELLLAPDQIAVENLRREGLDDRKIVLTGSTAIEACIRNSALSNSHILKAFDLNAQSYGICTLHRAENTDDPQILSDILEAFASIAAHTRLVFPMHPRTKKLASEIGVEIDHRILVIEPQGYLEFLSLLRNALFILTDSGGVQEEAAVLNVPCFILREETEWRYLVDAGKNMLVGNRKSDIIGKVNEIISHNYRLDAMRKARYDFDANASERIIDAIVNFIYKVQ